MITRSAIKTDKGTNPQDSLLYNSLVDHGLGHFDKAGDIGAVNIVSRSMWSYLLFTAVRKLAPVFALF